MSKGLFSTTYPDLDLSLVVDGRPTAFAFYWLGTLKRNFDVDPERNFLFLTVACVEKWNTLPPETKKLFEEVAEKEKDNYDMVAAAESWKIVSEIEAEDLEEHYQNTKSHNCFCLGGKCCHELPQENIQVPGSLDTLCAKKCKTMSEEEERRYLENSESTTKHDNDQRKVVEQSVKQQKQKTEPTAPRFPAPAWEGFIQRDEQTKAVEFSGYDVDQVQEFRKLWTLLHLETRSHYEAAAHEDQARYEKELKAYQEELNENQQISVEPDSNDAEEEDQEMRGEQEMGAHETKLVTIDLCSTINKDADFSDEE